MKREITRAERDVVDGLGAAVDSFKFGQRGIEEVLCTVYEIAADDAPARQAVHQFVHGDTVMSIEELHGRLGVAIAGDESQLPVAERRCW